MPDVKDWYTVDEINPAMLRGMQREVDPVQRRILDFAGVRTHSENTIRREVYIEDNTQMADIRGFTDPSVKLQGLETEPQVVSPWHIKNHFEFDNESKYTRQRGGTWQIASEGLVHSEQNVLEPARRNIFVYALLSMLNDRQFTYVDDNKGKVTVDYTDHIGQLPDPSSYLGSGSFEPYKFLRKMKQDFYNKTNLKPNLVFMNASVLNDFTALQEVKNKYEPQTPSDPDESEKTFEEFTFFGIRFVVLYDQYPDQDGVLHPAIKDKHMMVTVSDVGGQPGAASNPFLFDKAENDENEGDASRPHYNVKPIDNDPWKAGNFMYDNCIPTVSKKGIVQQWKVQN